MTVIKSGTVSIASGSADVVGVGTTWSTGPYQARAGDTFMVPGAGFVSTIAAVVSDTALTLESARSGAAIASAAYEIRLDAPERLSGVSAVAALGAMAARYELLASNIRLPLVVSVGTNAPPGAPVLGTRYVVGTAPTGAWAGYANQFAVAATSGWRFEAPVRGDGVADLTTGDFYFWSGAAWVSRSLNAGATRYDVAQALSGAQQTQALANLGVALTSGVAGTTQLATNAQLAALLPATSAGQVIQNVAGVLTARTVAQMLATENYGTGSWTPTLSGTGAEPAVTYSARSGIYWRMGRTVVVYGEVAGTRSGGSGDARIAGLPFPSVGCPIMLRPSGVTFSGAPFAYANSAGTALLGYFPTSGGVGEIPITSVAAGGFSIIICGAYIT